MFNNWVVKTKFSRLANCLLTVKITTSSIKTYEAQLNSDDDYRVNFCQIY